MNVENMVTAMQEMMTVENNLPARKPHDIDSPKLQREKRKAYLLNSIESSPPSVDIPDY